MAKQASSNRKLANITAVVGMIQFVIAAGLFIQLLSLDILPFRYLIAFGIGSVVYFLIVMISTMKKVPSIIFLILSIILAVVMIWGIRALWKLDDTVNTASTSDAAETTVMDVVVLDSDAAQSVADLDGYEIGYVTDSSTAESAISSLKSEVTGSVTTTGYDSMILLASALLDGSAKAIVIEDSYIDVIDELDDYEGFSDEIRILTSYEVAVSGDSENYDEDRSISGNENAFIVYLSGIDTTGSISATSRSDVNILAVVNQSTGTVLLLNTPRDAYVQLPLGGGSYDKLTHAGIYGIDVSLATLENLYDTDIDYYVRVNFTGFEEIINALGGVEVYSDYSFTTTKGGYTISKGYNSLNGAQALSFARERKAFSSGDVQRGKNQMEVISALIEKLQSSEMLLNYSTIMDEISESFQTNMSSDKIYELVQNQLDKGTDWEIEKYTVTGSGTNRTTYSIPGKTSYVIELSDSDIEQAKEYIEAVLNGEDITISEDSDE